MDGGGWWAAVHGVTKSWTRLSDFAFTFHFSCIGAGNGNPLQCSCLDRNRGAWWASVYGVAQSRTQLKWLSSSSSSSPWLWLLWPRQHSRWLAVEMFSITHHICWHWCKFDNHPRPSGHREMMECMVAIALCQKDWAIEIFELRYFLKLY